MLPKQIFWGIWMKLEFRTWLGTVGLILLLNLVPTVSNAEWVFFTLFKSPIHDARGDIYQWADVPRTPKPLYGAVILYPDLGGLNITERYDTGHNLLVNIEAVDTGEERQAQYVTVRTVSKTSEGVVSAPLKSAEYGWSDFRVKTVTAEEAENLKKDWGFALPSPEAVESGVTP